MDRSSELSKHVAPASAAGFLFQFQRAVQVLAEASNGVTLGIETLDDLSIERKSGERIHEQDKYTSNRAGSIFSDGSKNLLGTLATWLAALCSKEIPTTTRFLLVTNDTCRTGLVRQIADATSRDAAHACLKSVMELEGDSRPKRRLLSLLKDSRGQEMFLELCQAVELVDGDDVSMPSARNALVLPSPFEARREYVFDQLCGWMQAQALQSWDNGEPCRIGKQAFTNQLDAILNSLKRAKRREMPESQLPVSDEDIKQKQDATFVRQVGLVTDDDYYKNDAICDFIRCINEKTRLNKEGDISQKDWLDFADRLRRRWESIWHKNAVLTKDSEREKGFHTLTEVLSHDYHPTPAGEPTEQVYLANGTYHRFADEKAIGWHPRYLELLDEGERDGHLI